MGIAEYDLAELDWASVEVSMCDLADHMEP